MPVDVWGQPLRENARSTLSTPAPPDTRHQTPREHARSTLNTPLPPATRARPLRENARSTLNTPLPPGVLKVEEACSPNSSLGKSESAARSKPPRLGHSPEPTAHTRPTFA